MTTQMFPPCGKVRCDVCGQCVPSRLYRSHKETHRSFLSKASDTLPALLLGCLIMVPIVWYVARLRDILDWRD